MHALLGQIQVIQKVGLIGHPPKSCQYTFLHLKKPYHGTYSLVQTGRAHNLTEVNIDWRRGGGCTVRKLLQPQSTFNEKNEKFNHTDLVQHFYKDRPICWNQAVLNLCLKNICYHFFQIKQLQQLILVFIYELV